MIEMIEMVEVVEVVKTVDSRLLGRWAETAVDDLQGCYCLFVIRHERSWYR